MEKIIVEVCCNSIDDAIIAEKAGADRIELVTAGLIGGLTPTLGLLYEVKSQISIPVMSIIRPRCAGCFYSPEEFKVMCKDAKVLAENGSDGIVFGFLNSDGTVDYDRCRQFMEYTSNKVKVFHRAIDVVPDPLIEIKRLISIGVNRILTSGASKNAWDGRNMIKKFEKEFGTEIEILPGGGINASNARKLIEYTGVKQIHLGASSIMHDESTHKNRDIAFGTLNLILPDEYSKTDEEKLSAVINSI